MQTTKTASRPAKLFIAGIFLAAFIIPGMWRSAGAEQSANRANPALPRVRVLIASWCPYCQKLEKFLEEKQIPHESFDIERSSTGAGMYSKLGYPGVPVTIIGSTIISGYRPGEILEALSERKAW